jgi:hypothetical protein
MSDDSPGPREVLGTIVGIDRSGLAIIRLADGSEIRADAKRLHRPLGFLYPPVGRMVRLHFHPTKTQRMPRIVEVLPEEPKR